VEGAVCRRCGASNSPSWGAAAEGAVCRGCGASTARVGERLWKALYVDDAASPANGTACVRSALRRTECTRPTDVPNATFYLLC
jgi:ribosomal protein L40E